MLTRTSRYLLAAIQAIIGWEWIMSGGNKLFSGTFPQGLADALTNSFKDNPNGWYVSFLKQVVVPNSVFFGYLIEWTEIIVGIVLVSGAILLLSKPRMPGDPQNGLNVAYCIAVVVAAAIGAFQNINFHFFMGGWVLPTFDPGNAYNEGIDLEALLPLFFLVIIIANLAMVQALSGIKLFKRTKQTRTTAPEPAASNS